MTEQELNQSIADMWDDIRADGDMVIDAPARKVGMPYTAPFEGVCFPVEIDGHLSFVSIPAEEVKRFAAALVALVPESINLDNECESEIAAHEAICKAKGE